MNDGERGGMIGEWVGGCAGVWKVMRRREEREGVGERND